MLTHGGQIIRCQLLLQAGMIHPIRKREPVGRVKYDLLLTTILAFVLAGSHPLANPLLDHYPLLTATL